MNKKLFNGLFFSFMIIVIQSDLVAITQAQYHTITLASQVDASLLKGTRTKLTSQERADVVRNITEISNYSPEKADEIKEKIRSSNTLYPQFADFVGERKVEKRVSASEVIGKMPTFEQEVKKDITQNLNNPKELTKELLKDQEIAKTLDKEVCKEGICTQPFTEQFNTIVQEESKKIGIDLPKTISQNQSSISQKLIKQEVQEDLTEVFHLLFKEEEPVVTPSIPVSGGKTVGTTQQELEKIYKASDTLIQEASKLQNDSMQQRMSKEKGYYHLVQKLETWWSEIEKRSDDINPTDFRKLESKKTVIAKTIANLLFKDMDDTFSKFKLERLSSGAADFPYYQIVLIQDATRKKLPDFMQSPGLYGNKQTKELLDTKFKEIYDMLVEAQFSSIINNRHIKAVVFDDSGAVQRGYAEIANHIQARVFGQLGGTPGEYNKSSFGALIWSIAYYINTVVWKTQDEKQKAVAFSNLYVKDNLTLLIDFRDLFKDIIEPKYAQAVIQDILSLTHPVLLP